MGSVKQSRIFIFKLPIHKIENHAPMRNVWDAGTDITSGLKGLNVISKGSPRINKVFQYIAVNNQIKFDIPHIGFA